MDEVGHGLENGGGYGRGDGDLDQITWDERHIGGNCSREVQAESDHETDAAAHILCEDTEDAREKENEHPCPCVTGAMWRAIGDGSDEEGGDEVAHEITDGRAGYGAKGGLPAGEIGNTDETDAEEKSGCETAPCASKKHRGDGYAHVLKNDGDTEASYW